MIKLLTLFKKITLYFPARLMICSAFLSYILINNYPDLQMLENKILLGLLHFFQVPSFLDSQLYIGGSYTSVPYDPPLHIQLIFLIFFAAFAISTSSSFEKRRNLLLFGGLCFAGFIISQLLVIMVQYWLGIMSYSGLFIVNLFVTAFVGAAAIEACFLTSITKPPRIKVRSLLIKRS